MDGFQLHKVLEGWALDNVFTGNNATVSGTGYGFLTRRRTARFAPGQGCVGRQVQHDTAGVPGDLRGQGERRSRSRFGAHRRAGCSVKASSCVQALISQSSATMTCQIRF